ncbi:MAG TPA: aspartyl protease family protein [Flavobacterium sp.]|nr:aspartyl protease family protein [Flavobacterium sp.]
MSISLTAVQVPFVITETNHLIISISINSIRARLLVDTGASASCLSYEMVKKLSISTSKFTLPMSSANALIEEPMQTDELLIQTQHWKKHAKFIVIDLKTINDSLHPYIDKPIDGILGTDVLHQSKAVIDFRSNTIKLF